MLPGGSVPYLDGYFRLEREQCLLSKMGQSLLPQCNSAKVFTGKVLNHCQGKVDLTADENVWVLSSYSQCRLVEELLLKDTYLYPCVGIDLKESLEFCCLVEEKTFFRMHWLTLFMFFIRISTSLLQALNETDIPETRNATTTAPVIKGPELATILVPCVIGCVATLGIVLFFLVIKIRETQHLERTLSTRHLDPTGVVLPNNSFKLPPVE